MKSTRTRRPSLHIGDTIAVRAAVARDWRCPSDRKNHRTAIVVGVDNRTRSVNIRIDRDLRGSLHWNRADVKIVRRAR